MIYISLHVPNLCFLAWKRCHAHLPLFRLRTFSESIFHIFHGCLVIIRDPPQTHDMIQATPSCLVINIDSHLSLPFNQSCPTFNNGILVNCMDQPPLLCFCTKCLIMYTKTRSSDRTLPSKSEN